jgi:hypothetical protein
MSVVVRLSGKRFFLKRPLLKSGVATAAVCRALFFGRQPNANQDELGRCFVSLTIPPAGTAARLPLS